MKRFRGLEVELVLRDLRRFFSFLELDPVTLLVS